MTAFIVDHQCPQCGAPVQLEESDRFLRCNFCRTGSFLTTNGYFRYRLPHHAPPSEQMIYVPYWRFRGMLFSCLQQRMHHRFIDFSQQAVRSPYFPLSLGFRSQTQKLQFAVPTAENAVFINPRLSVKKLEHMLIERCSADLPKPIVLQEFIGETISLIYAPYHLKGQVIIDGLSGKPGAGFDGSQMDDLLSGAGPPEGQLLFIPALCPECGWELNGQNNALALPCVNCKRVWQAQGGRLAALKAYHLPGADRAVYLPFWRIKADTTRIELGSYADFIRIANLPKAVQPGSDTQPFFFWAPAFKVRPQHFLTLATNLTVSQLHDRWLAGGPPGLAHAVNLPLSEAVDSIKLTLAGFMRPRERMIDEIPFVSIKAREYQLIYLPFREDHHELVHDGIRLAIGKNLLKQAENL